jgi:hypothetical protein
MTKDDVLRMAREAGFADGVAEIVGLEGFARFAKLVYEKAWVDTALAATHTVTDAAIAKEREACAKVCDKLWNAAECAEAIRARSNP